MARLSKSSRPPWLSKREPHGRRKKRDKNKRFYNSKAWKRLREAKISQDPLCEECLRHGLTTPGDEVDHIKPINQGGPPLEWDNLQTLCRHHHAAKSAREAGRGGGNFRPE